MGISSAAVAETLFVICVAIATIVPRPKTQQGSFFGGDLSRPFRQLMFALTCLNFSRSVVMTDPSFRDHRTHTDSDGKPTFANWIYYFMKTIEALGFSILCLLLAYLLQCRLRSLIFIEPGKDLQPWLVAIFVLGLVGLVTSAKISPHYWVFKRLGDALSCFPILKTINLYESVMTRNHILDSQVTLQTLRTMKSSIWSPLYWQQGVIGLQIIAKVGTHWIPVPQFKVLSLVSAKLQFSSIGHVHSAMDCC